MVEKVKSVVKKIEASLPGPVLSYGLPLFGLAAILGTAYLFYVVLGVRQALLFGLLSILGLIVLLGAAWLGYGPGILVCAIVTLVLPHLRPGGSRTTNVDISRFVLVLVISLLVSRISQTGRRRESDLRRTAGELEIRVRERTDEALRSAGAVQEAEDRLRLVLDSARIGYWDYDIAKDQTYRSRKHDEVFGYKEALPEWNHETFRRHVHPADREMVERRFQEAVRGAPVSVEFRVVWVDQSIHWAWLEGQTQNDANGAPSHISGVIMDVTARKKTADDLGEKAQLLDLAHDAILSLEWDGTITFWSRGAEQMYGWTRAEAMGKQSHALLQTVFPQPQDEIRARLVSTGHWEGELQHLRRDGAQLKVASRWALRRSVDQQPHGYLEINTDVTERHRIEEQLRHTQKLESLGVLAGGVAHDFNNLLTGILGNASLALEELPQSNPNRELLDEVLKAAGRAADLTRQLLAYAGKGRFVMRTLDLSELVREIGGLIQTSIPKTVQLRLQLNDRLPGIDADPGQVQQIVMNLVINGAEAVGKEGGSVLVRTGIQPVDQDYIETMSSAGELLRPGQYVNLEVHDTGSGMTPEILAKIFDPFFTTKFAGRGLGLSAVLGIVRAHRGALKVYSTLGQGTTFKVLFPASVNPVGNQPTAIRRSLEGSGTVLIVDDEELVCQTARHTLERYGYQTLTAADGAMAVDLYRRMPEAIRLVMLDLTMPVMDGEEALRNLQVINPNVRVLLTSGYNEVEAVQRFTGKGLAGFIQKPFTAAALAEKVKEVLTV